MNVRELIEQLEKIDPEAPVIGMTFLELLDFTVSAEVQGVAMIHQGPDGVPTANLVMKVD